MSDRIAVMSNGEVQQIGEPHEIYDRPDNRFVADFIGDSNFLEGTISAINGGEATCDIGDSLRIDTRLVGNSGVGDNVTLAVRPEKIELDSDGSWHVVESTFLGTDTTYSVSDGTSTIAIRAQNTTTGRARFAQGDSVSISIAPDTVRMLKD